MRKLAAIVSLTFALGALVGCSAKDEESGAGGITSGGSSELEAPTAAEDAATGGGNASGRRLAGQDSVPEVGPQVIQTASVELAVRRGRFGEVVDEARSIAGGFGGFVVSSTASQGPEQRLVRGTLVLRIPARSYADAMRSLTELGRVESRNESGQDVSQEYVDLRARARQLQAVEAQLLELLDRADTVGAALAVQQQLANVQLQLEEARGRIQYLDDQVAFATISLAIHEALVPVATGDEGGFGIVEAWQKAANGFLAVVGWTLVVIATAAPLILLLVLLWLVARFAARRSFGRQWPRLKSD
jgi:Domain of unknown function (DUF4349)